MRPARIVAIARRDLALELSGRRGWVLPFILAGLLLPTSTIRVSLPNRSATPPALRVSGEVPPAVRALGVEEVDGDAPLAFREEDGVTVVRAKGLREDVRKALDGDAPSVTVRRALRPIRLPGRSLLFALISASTLTGAVSTSIAGERAAGTLVGLLAAAVSRTEIIAGKWLAWGGLGALASMLAAGSALALGRVVPGWWLIPLPVVAPATVALGFWLVRRATDVVTGTTVSLRVLPAALSISGLLAWFLGRVDPLLGASVPLGGALVAAGGTWAGPLPAIVAAASALALSGACLALTARDLEDAPREPLPGRTLGAAALTTSLAAGLWWVPILTPLLWAAAGNEALTEELPRAAGVLAGGLGLGLLALNGAATTDSIRRTLGLDTPVRLGLLAAPAVGLALALVHAGAPLTALGGFEAVSERLLGAAQPAWAGPAAIVLAVVGQELLLRGWIQRQWGVAVAVAAHVAILTPTDPVGGLLQAALLSGLVAASGGSVWGALLARVVAVLAAGAVVGVSPASALAVGALGALATGVWAWRR